MTNDIFKMFVNAKNCFGKHEDSDNSWHCKGCMLEEECKTIKGEGEKYEEDCANAQCNIQY